MIVVQGLLSAAGGGQEAGDDRGAGADLLPLLHALPRRGDHDAGPGRPLHCLLCPRAHHHLGKDCPQGS